MLTITPYIFNQLPEIDDEKKVTENRGDFFNSLGLESSAIAFQHQVHGNNISVVSSDGSAGKSDALITTCKNLGIAISSADCCAIFIYDPVNEIVAGVHSGWRGTQKEILIKVLQKLSNDFDSNPGDLVCYIAPSITGINYEVGVEVAEQFDSNYVFTNSDKDKL